MLDITVADAFTDQAFSGNPAAVCLLPPELDATERWMQQLAVEMNLSETAYLVRRPGADHEFSLRWFTPGAEVALCGHATLASAHVLWEQHGADPKKTLRFHTKSGVLTAVRKNDGSIALDFPSKPVAPTKAPAGLAKALDAELVACHVNDMDYVVELKSEAVVRSVKPDFKALAALGMRGVAITAKAETKPYDIVSRFFVPAVGIDEDPVTGSAHCALAPFWSPRLGNRLVAYQASARGGRLDLTLSGDRVELAGRAVTTWKGALTKAALPAGH